jgi:hypothetical protein
MTNDECLMTKEARTLKAFVALSSGFVIEISFVIGHWSFVITFTAALRSSPPLPRALLAARPASRAGLVANR